MSFAPIPLRIEDLVRQAINAAQAAGSLPAVALPNIPVSRSKRPDQGQYGVACMALAKPMGMKPLDIANILAAHLPAADFLTKAEVFAPGFLNFYLDDTWLVRQVEAIIAAGETVFQQDFGQGKRVNVEFVSANPTGPVHIGRTRGAVVGDSIGRLMEACGWQVHREYYFNNGGRQMQMLGESLQIRYRQQLGQDVALADDHYQGEYLVDMAQTLVADYGDTWLEHDWLTFKDYAEKAIFKLIEATLDRIGVKFDMFFNELDVYADNSVWDVRDRLTAAGQTYQAATHANATPEEIAEATAKGYEPATWFRSTNFGDDQDRIIVRSNNEPTVSSRLSRLWLTKSVAAWLRWRWRGSARAPCQSFPSSARASFLNCRTISRAST